MVLFDFSADYEVFDTVQLDCVLARHPDLAVVYDVAAIQGAAAQIEIPPGDPLFSPEATYATWSIYAATLGAIEPKPGDTLEDTNGTTWTLLSVSFQTLTQVYSCKAVKQAANS